MRSSRVCVVLAAALLSGCATSASITRQFYRDREEWCLKKNAMRVCHVAGSAYESGENGFGKNLRTAGERYLMSCLTPGFEVDVAENGTMACAKLMRLASNKEADPALQRWALESACDRGWLAGCNELASREDDPAKAHALYWRACSAGRKLPVLDTEEAKVGYPAPGASPVRDRVLTGDTIDDAAHACRSLAGFYAAGRGVPVDRQIAAELAIVSAELDLEHEEAWWLERDAYDVRADVNRQARDAREQAYAERAERERQSNLEMYGAILQGLGQAQQTILEQQRQSAAQVEAARQMVRQDRAARFQPRATPALPSLREARRDPTPNAGEDPVRAQQRKIDQQRQQQQQQADERNELARARQQKCVMPPNRPLIDNNMSSAHFEDDALSFRIGVIAHRCIPPASGECADNARECSALGKQILDHQPMHENGVYVADIDGGWLGQPYVIQNQGVHAEIDTDWACSGSHEGLMRAAEARKRVAQHHVDVKNEWHHWYNWARWVTEECLAGRIIPQ